MNHRESPTERHAREHRAAVVAQLRLGHVVEIRSGTDPIGRGDKWSPKVHDNNWTVASVGSELIDIEVAARQLGKSNQELLAIWDRPWTAWRHSTVFCQCGECAAAEAAHIAANPQCYRREAVEEALAYCESLARGERSKAE